MANPFNVRFTSQCHHCEEDVPAGSQMYAHKGGFYCQVCAKTGDLICKCGNYKKEEYELCYECNMVERERMINESSSDDTPF